MQTLSIPATIFILDAFVHKRLEKFVKFKIGLSISYNNTNGPSNFNKGSSGKTNSPSSAPYTFI
jgi:hypothetical protein